MASDIKISTSMDVSSFRLVDNAIKSLITSVDKLNRSMENVARSVGKIQSVGNTAGTAASIKSPSRSNQGILGAILGGSDNSSVGRMVSEADRALETVSRKTKSFVDRVSSDISRLNGSIGSIGATKGSDAGWSGRLTSQIENNRPVPSLFGPAPQGGLPIPPQTVGGGFTPRMFGGGGGFMRGGVGGGSGSITGALGDVEMMAGGNVVGGGASLLSKLPAIGLAAAVGYGVYKVADAFTGSGANVYDTNLKFRLNNPIDQMQTTAALQSPFRNMIGSAIGKDYASMAAWRDVFKRKDIVDSVSNVNINKDMIDTIMGTRSISGGVKKKVSELAARVADAGLSVGEFIGGGAERLGLKGEELRAVTNIVKEQAQNQVARAIPGRLNEAHEAEMAQQNPYTAMMENRIGQEFMGRYQTMALGGRSLKPVKIKNADGSVTELSAYEVAEEKALRRGTTLGEENSNYQSLLGIGKGYTFLGGHRIVAASQGGFTNIGQATRMAGMLSGSVSDAKDYIYGKKDGSSARTIIGGATGLDVSVGNDLFSKMPGVGLQQGWSYESLLGITQQRAAMISGGGQDVAYQQRMAWGIEEGNQVTQNYDSGTRSSFDKVVAMRDAILAAGGKYGRVSKDLFLLEGRPDLLASRARGEKLPPGISAGVTPEMARDLMNRAGSHGFNQVIDNLEDYAPDAARLKTLRSTGGDVVSTINAELARTMSEEDKKEKHSKAWFRKVHELSETYGGMMPANTIEEKLKNVYSVEQRVLNSRSLVAPHGTGFERPGFDKNSTEYQAAINAADEKRLQAEAGGSAEVKKNVKINPAGFATVAEEQRSSFNKNLDVFLHDGIPKFSQAIENFGIYVSSLTGIPIKKHTNGPSIRKLPDTPPR